MQNRALPETTETARKSWPSGLWRETFIFFLAGNVKAGKSWQVTTDTARKSCGQ
jgi:hypothetical protein